MVVWKVDKGFQGEVLCYNLLKSGCFERKPKSPSDVDMNFLCDFLASSSSSKLNAKQCCLCAIVVKFMFKITHVRSLMECSV